MHGAAYGPPNAAHVVCTARIPHLLLDIKKPLYKGESGDAIADSTSHGDCCCRGLFIWGGFIIF